MAALDHADRARISEAVREAEANTAGEIYVVVARAADEYPLRPGPVGGPGGAAGAVAAAFADQFVRRHDPLVQAVTFVWIAVAASHPAIRYRIVPASIAADAARKAAQSLFLAHGVHLTEARTGVLIYVALAERRVEIVADAGINAKVEQAAWDELAGEIVAAARANALVDGLVAAVRRAGSLLAEHFPPRPDDRNELPDRVVEI